MARTMVDHACERCGAIRKVSPDKLAKGLQRFCRRCQGPVAAEKRRDAMLRRGGPKAVTYGACKECMKIYEMAPIDDNGFCSESCEHKAESRGHSRQEMVAAVINRLWRPPQLSRENRWEQMGLFAEPAGAKG